MKDKLEVGDIIHKTKFGKVVNTWKIDKVTKTLAKSEYAIFYRGIADNGYVERKNESYSPHTRYEYVKP